VTAGDWATVVVGVAALIVAVAALPPNVRHKGRVIAASGFLVLLAIGIGIVNHNPRPPDPSSVVPTITSPTSRVTTSPSSGNPTSESPDVPDPPPPTAESAWYYLESLPRHPDSDAPGSPVGPASTDGKEYDHSVTHQPYSSGESVLVFNLERRCRTFAFTVGISEDSPDVGINVASVAADGTQLARYELRTRSRTAEFDVTGALRLQLTVRGPSTRVYVVWGDARIQCAPLKQI
jgi:hypothetical protein